MFEKFRKEQLERHAREAKKLENLETARTAARHLLSHDEIPQLEAALETLKRAHGDAEYPMDGTGAFCRELYERIGLLKRRAYEQALRPCTHCGGRDFRISNARDLEFFGALRLVVCEACGLTQLFWTKLASLPNDPFFSSTFRVPAGNGPFR